VSEAQDGPWRRLEERRPGASGAPCRIWSDTSRVTKGLAEALELSTGPPWRE
jgi:hypothetical protein